MTDLRANPFKGGGDDVTRISSGNKSYDGLAYGYVCGRFGLIIMVSACVLIRKKAQEVIHQSQPNFMKLKVQESSKNKWFI